jgi:hypothetical protein
VFYKPKEERTMRKNTTTLAHPASTNPTSQQKPVSTSKGKAASEETIRVRAYQKWESAGKPGGDGVKFWLEAEREALQAKIV